MKKSNFHTTIGAIAAIGKYQIEFNKETTWQDGTVMATHRLTEYSGGWSFGVSNSTGIEFQTNSAFKFFIELDIYAQSYGARKSEILEYNINGEDLISSLSVSQIYADHVDSLNESEIQNPDEPSKYIRSFIPFNSAGLSAGISVSLFGN